MLQVYDRVLPSGSVPTLIGLGLLVVFLYAFQGVLEALRMRILTWTSAVIDEHVGRRIHDISAQLPLRSRGSADGSLAQRDLDQVRSYLSSVGPIVFFDLPWMPLYLGICFLFHFWIGVLATAGAILLCSLTYLTECFTVAPPGEQRVTLSDVTFELEAGQALGIIGPSASGKSTHARTLVGAWSPLRGKVRLDGAPLDRWSPASLGPHIGYLPQDIELLAGSVSENISRFEEEPDPAAIFAAAQAAGVHEMILRLTDGYETQIGDSGAVLSAGQRQRIALARALYGNPFLVVLDEPNSNLDAEGDAALTEAILSVRARGGIAVIVAHRPSALSAVDHFLAMANGRVQSFGTKEEVLGKVLQRPAVAGGLRVMPASDGRLSS